MKLYSSALILISLFLVTCKSEKSKNNSTTFEVQGIDITLIESDTSDILIHEGMEIPCYDTFPKLRKEKKLEINGIDTECITGKIFVQVKITKSGLISEKRIVRSYCEELNNDALKLVSSLEYEPVVCKGDTLEVTFVIQVKVK